MASFTSTPFNSSYSAGQSRFSVPLMGTGHAFVMLDAALQKDREYGDLQSLLNVSKPGRWSNSGRLDSDYPIPLDPQSNTPIIAELGDMRRIPLPAELVEQFGHIQCNCLMGLFTEISRAWLSIDSSIFVWNYEDGSDLAYFDGLSETILSTGLVKPKRGVFQPHIQYLLCLTTPLDIILLGVSFTNPRDATTTRDASLGEMHLLPEPLFTLPTNNIHIINITGTNEGRIFMAGRDACLYEFFYQAEGGWLSRKCWKINHSQNFLSFLVPSFLSFSFVQEDPLVQMTIDSSRQILYVRSERGTIQVYDLGVDGRSTTLVARTSHENIVNNAEAVATDIDKSHYSKIVYIAAIPFTESVHLHLVAITGTGVRLYFSTIGVREPRLSDRPSMIRLVHIRMPPGYGARAPPQRPTNVHLAHYSKGTMVVCASETEDSDLLFAVSPDSFPFQNILLETNECRRISGRTWAIAEVPTDPLFRFRPPSKDHMISDPPAVVTQHMDSSRRFVLLNSQGSYVVNKFVPVDQLRQLLVNYGPDSNECRLYFNTNKDESCATCLVLICSSAGALQEVVDLATRAFFLHGGEAHFSQLQQPFGVATVGPRATAPARLGRGSGLYPDLSALTSPTQPFGNVAQNLSFSTPAQASMVRSALTPHSPAFGSAQPMQAQVAPGFIYSGKHNGLYLHVGRLLRLIWNVHVVEEVDVVTAEGRKRFLSGAIPIGIITWILNKLTVVIDFLNRYSEFTSPYLVDSSGFPTSITPFPRAVDGQGGIVGGMAGAGSVMDEQTRRRLQAEAEALESQSLKQLQQLVTQVCECLGLWRILQEHQFYLIARDLAPENIQKLKTMTFSAFVQDCWELSYALINNLIAMYINDNATTDAISSRLREVCGALYSREDALSSKGNEKLRSARTVQNPQDKARTLEEALKYYKQISDKVDLTAVCSQFAAAHFYPGIVDLVLTATAKRDSQGIALHYYKNSQPAEDRMGAAAFAMRMDCYKLITDTLEHLLSSTQSHPQAPSVPSKPRPQPTQLDPNRLTNVESDKYAEQVFALALKSDDELLHVAIFSWLIVNNHDEKLLEIQSPYLESYLKRAASAKADYSQTLDLLWKYYEKNQNFHEAARILSRLADCTSARLGLKERMEYLSRAMICAKSATSPLWVMKEDNFLYEMEEKMDVARLQLQIYEALSQRPNKNRTAQEALKSLGSALLDISTLYRDYADRFNLAECKLASIHCGEYYEPTLVETIWKDIIESEIVNYVGLHDVITQMRCLRDKLVILGRTYATNQKYFPLTFLIKYMEHRSCQLGFDQVNRMYVVSIFQEIGLTLPPLFENYDLHLKAKDQCWKAVKKPHHLLYVIHGIMSAFVDSPTVVPAYDRRSFTTTCLDATARYLVDLQAEIGDTEVRQLINMYKEIQTKLNRQL